MADRYWVGGTAAWDGTAGTKWATSSGGLGGASVPTSADDVFFTNLSTGTCTISTGNTGAKSINCTGFTGTIAGTAAITVSGSVTLVAGMTYTYTGTLTINAASTLTSGGKAHGSITFNASGSTLTLGDACTLGSANTFTLTAGTIALNGFTLTTGIFSSSNSNTRAITFGSQNIVLVGTTAGTTALAMATASNFTWTGTGAFARSMIGTATFQFGSTSGGTESNAPNISLIGGAATLTITSGSYFKNFSAPSGTNGSTLSGSAFFAGNVTLSNTGFTTAYTGFNPTFITSGTLTSAGRTLGNVTVNGAGATLTLADALTLGTTNTFTLTQGTLDLNGNTLSTGIFSSSNSNTRSITFGSANIALTSTTAATTVLAMATATGFTWTGTGGFTRNMAATATVQFGSTAGGSESNAPNLTVNAGASTLTITSGSFFKNVIFTGSTSTVIAASYNACGNLTLATGGSYSSVLPTFRASGTLTTAGRSLDSLIINGSGITVTLADALSLLVSGGSVTLTQGTFDAANFNVSTVNFSSNTSNTRTLNMGTGTWTITGPTSLGIPPWDIRNSTNMTLNSSTSTINMTNASAKTFGGGGLTYYNLNQGGAGTLTISGSNTFNNITNSTQPATVTFTAGTTQTVSNFGLSGTAGNLITINSSTPGSQFTLSKASGTINAQYLSIQDSNATGGAVWNALLTNGNVNAGNNLGWIFDTSSGNMFLMFM